jgi:hypothetical protein
MPIWPGGVANSSVKIRTSRFNTYNANNSSFLLFNSTILENTINQTSFIPNFWNVSVQDFPFSGKYYQIK